MLGTAVSQGVYFYLYSRFRQLAVTRLQSQKQTKSEDIGVGASLLVAFLAGCGNVLLTTPIWTVTTRMQVGVHAFLRPLTYTALSPNLPSPYLPLNTAAVSVCMREPENMGSGLVFCGFCPSSTLALPATVVHRLLLTLKITYSTALPVKLRLLVAACLGAISDRACLLLQAQQKKAGGLPDPKKREGPVKTAQDIYEEGGVKV